MILQFLAPVLILSLLLASAAIRLLWMGNTTNRNRATLINSTLAFILLGCALVIGTSIYTAKVAPLFSIFILLFSFAALISWVFTKKRTGAENRFIRGADWTILFFVVTLTLSIIQSTIYFASDPRIMQRPEYWEYMDNAKAPS